MNIKLKEHEALLALLVVVLFIGIVVHAVFLSSTKNIISSTEAINDQYKKAYQLYLKIKSNNSSNRVFKSNLLLFVQKLQGIDDLKKKIVGASLAGDNTLHLRLTMLNLNELVDVLKTIEGYSNIDIAKFSISRSFISKDKVDLIVVLRKEE